MRTVRPAGQWTAGWARALVGGVASWARSRVLRCVAVGPVVRVRSVAAYRARKAPADLVRLVWFVLRGNWRWLVKLWNWATYADLRADARAARLAGDTEARRTAQEAIRADAKARWARVGIVLRRAVITARVVAVVARGAVAGRRVHGPGRTCGRGSPVCTPPSMRCGRCSPQRCRWCWCACRWCGWWRRRSRAATATPAPGG